MISPYSLQPYLEASLRKAKGDTPPPSQAPRLQGDESNERVGAREHLRYGHQGPKRAKGCPSFLQEGYGRAAESAGLRSSDGLPMRVVRCGVL